MVNRKRLPLSGTEPVLYLEDWLKPTIANCYSAALLDPLNRPGLEKAQPGDRAGLSRVPLDLTTCEVSSRMLADNPGNIYKERAETPCQRGFHKIFVFNDPRNKGGDYHVYFQTNDIVMAIQPGMTQASLAKEFGIPYRNVQNLGNGQVMLRNTGLWSHKMGYTPGALLKDSCGKIITDPRKACRFVGKRKYSLNCGSLCARSGVAKTRPDYLYH